MWQGVEHRELLPPPAAWESDPDLEAAHLDRQGRIMGATLTMAERAPNDFELTCAYRIPERGTITVTATTKRGAMEALSRERHRLLDVQRWGAIWWRTVMVDEYRRLAAGDQ